MIEMNCNHKNMTRPKAIRFMGKQIEKKLAGAVLPKSVSFDTSPIVEE
jgi:hypothetical protein